MRTDESAGMVHTPYHNTGAERHSSEKAASMCWVGPKARMTLHKLIVAMHAYLTAANIFSNHHLCILMFGS